MPQDSEVFAESFATALAALHAVPISAAVDAGMLIRTPTQARQKVADDVDRVRREFVVNDKRLHRWQRWLDDDSSWPDFSVVVHGDLYVGHVLIDNTERVSGMIDWSEARVDDPAIDMAAHLMVFGEEGLAKLLLTYEAAGGRVWPRLAHHIAERLAFGAVTYALFALDSGNEEYLAAAKAQLATSGMSERRYSPLATLFAATFLFRIGNAVAALALPWFVLSHTKSAAWAGATAASSVIATIIGAWVGGGLVDRFGRAPVALISGVVGGVAMASIPLLDAVGALSNTGLIACVVLGAAFDAPGMAAQDSELPKLGHVAGLSVERVSSLKAVIGNVAILGGPALGGPQSACLALRQRSG